MAASLDGRIAGPRGEADWIPADPDIDFAALFGEFDTLLMGRRTWDSLVRDAGADAMAGGAFGMATVVASRTMRAADHPGIRIVSGDLGPFVRSLLARPGKDVWLFGGGDLCAAVLDLGLVDTFEIAVVPVVLGRGAPLVAPTSQRHVLRYARQRVYPRSGIVLLEYDVVRA